MESGHKAQERSGSVVRNVRPILPQAVGVAGSVVLAAGVFAPTLHQPQIGSLNFYNDGTNYGIVVIALAAVSLYLAATKRARGLWLTGIPALLLVGYSLYGIFSMLDDLGSMSSKGATGFLENVRLSAAQGVYLQWGWIALFGGVGLFLAAAYMAQRERPRASRARKP